MRRGSRVSGTTRFVSVAVVVSALLVGAVALTGCGGNSPQDAVSKYLNAWQSSNWNEYKASIVPGRTKLTKLQEELAKQEFGQVKVKVQDIKMKTAYDPKDKNKARVTLTGGKITYKANVVGRWKTDVEDISKMKENEKPAFPTQKVKGTWYVDIDLG